ncbi:MAG TPA: response regulator transcription factor [Cyclobacteriaceae bacterium]|nr:response regulator transcription factor [Cyclobacteriaceae bacterium]
MKYRILLVDDHQILLEGTKSIIDGASELFEVTDTAHTPERAQELLKNNDYDILITDYEMPNMKGLELIKIAKTVLPEIKTIVLSMHDEPSVIRELLKMGADGFILKKDTHQSIIDALDKVVRGKRFLSEDVSDILIQNIDADKNKDLTPREVEITKLIAKEYSTRQIADILFISERTVETHRKNILKKTGTNNVVGLVRYAFKNNLV